MLRTVQATRYVSPLREGGSLPALVEADDDGLYVVKLRGAGQGSKSLIAELIVGQLMHHVAAKAPELGLNMPELALVDLPRELSAAEPDPEIQELLEWSSGINVGLDFLPQSLPYAPAGGVQPTPRLAAAIVWLDAYTENVDRTPRNPNLLTWHNQLWIIDNGAALFKQHVGLKPDAADGTFPIIKDHVLLPVAGSIIEADELIAPLITSELLNEIIGEIPESLFSEGRTEPTTKVGTKTPPPTEARNNEPYAEYLWRRLQQPRKFVEQAEAARVA